MDVSEILQTIVNEYIRKIIVHAPDKSGGMRRQKMQIVSNSLDDDELFSLNGIVVAISIQKS